MSNESETLFPDLLSIVTGGFSKSDMPPAAQWMMEHQAPDDPHSTAFGAFKLIEATRRRYMGANWQSTDLHDQYSAATKYVKQQYGGWNQAEAFWKKHGRY